MSHHLGELQGTSWHIEFVRKAENDPKRHRNRCSHYKTDKTCPIYGMCIGSSHCSFYRDIALEKERKRSKDREKTWKVSASHQLFPDLVQLEDNIILYSLDEDENIVVKIKDKTENMPEIQYECLGRKLGDYFSFAKFLYQIISIEKPNGRIVQVDRSTIKESKRKFSKNFRSEKTILDDLCKDRFPSEKTYLKFIDLLNCLSQHTKKAIDLKMKNLFNSTFKTESQNIMLYLQQAYDLLKDIDKNLKSTHFTINHAIKFVDSISKNNTNKHLLEEMVVLFQSMQKE